MLETYALDWLTLLLRWAHVIVAVAWIGASFHFVALDNSLTPPDDPRDRDKGIGGERWAVHGGGFYHQQKYPVSPRRLPERLHWSMWESYSTWLTGFALFTVTYLWQAGSFLIDRQRFDWSPPAAAAAALGFLVGFWVVYDIVCRVFGQRRHGDGVVAALVCGCVVFAAWLSCQLFAGRAAFLLAGAMLASAMSANVLFWIIPGQRKVVAALRAGQPVDPLHGRRGKQRSVHNTYFTLPVLLAMLSNHFSLLHSSKWNWAWLVLLMASGALIRASFVMRHQALAKGRPVPWRYAALGVVILAGVVVALAPRPAATPRGAPPPHSPASAAGAGAPLPAAGLPEVQRIVTDRCVMCHNAGLANKGVALDTLEDITRNAQQIHQQAVLLKAMPLNNASQMTDAERDVLRRWFEASLQALPTP